QRFIAHAYWRQMDSVSVWRYGTASNEIWDPLATMAPAPPPPPAPPVAPPPPSPAPEVAPPPPPPAPLAVAGAGPAQPAIAGPVQPQPVSTPLSVPVPAKQSIVSCKSR